MKLETRIRHELVGLYWQAFSDGRVWEREHADMAVLGSEAARELREKSILPAEEKILEAVKREVKKAAA